MEPLAAGGGAFRTTKAPWYMWSSVENAQETTNPWQVPTANAASHDGKQPLGDRNSQRHHTLEREDPQYQWFQDESHLPGVVICQAIFIHPIPLTHKTDLWFCQSQALELNSADADVDLDDIDVDIDMTTSINSYTRTYDDAHIQHHDISRHITTNPPISSLQPVSRRFTRHE